MPIREPAVAGTFYPSEPSEIRSFLKAHLKPSAHPLTAKAVILPHAGYIYSGPTACRVLRQVSVPERIFLIGPNHRGVGADFAFFGEGEWKTPLGRVAIDSPLTETLLKKSRFFENDPAAHFAEHSLEVIVPLLQEKNPHLKIAPLLVGTLDLDRAREAAMEIAEVIAPSLSLPLHPAGGGLGWGGLVVVSTDMSHYESDAATRKKDRYALEAIEHLDAEGLVKAVRAQRITMCGFIPVYMLLVMHEKLGIKKASLVEYTTSAAASGDYDRVVGYAGFILE